jgi:hypothetical protein
VWEVSTAASAAKFDWSDSDERSPANDVKGFAKPFPDDPRTLLHERKSSEAAEFQGRLAVA